MKLTLCLKYSLVTFIWTLSALANATEKRGIAGKLFFVAGSPGKKTPQRYPTALYGVNKNIALIRLRPITTHEQGAEFIKIYHEDHSVLIGNISQQGFFQLDYINMNHVMREKSYEIELCKGCNYTRSYHLNKNGKRLHMIKALKSTSDKTVETSFYGLDYNSGNTVELSDEDINFAKTFGTSSGNFGHDHIKWLYAFDKRPSFYGTKQTYLNWDLPKFYHTVQHERFEQSINNQSIRVITPHKLIEQNKEGGRVITHFVEDKKSNQWSSFTLKNAGLLRGFDQWLVTEEQYLGFDRQKELSELAKQRYEQKVGFLPYRNVLERFQSWDIRKTGLLHLINPIKDIHIEIKTGKPDSEIILVENNLVVYRVEDQIFTADITGKKITNTQRLLKHDMVPAIHWAFMGKM